MGARKRSIGNDESEDSSGSDVSMSDSDGSSDHDLDNESVEAESDDKVTEENKIDDNLDEGDEEDEVIKAIKAEKTKKRDHPPTINTEDFIVDICLHPARDLIAVATIMGDVFIYEYNNNETKLVETHELHLKACRAVEFDTEGTTMFTTAKDKAIIATDTATGKMKRCYEDAHEDPVYSLKCLDENKIVTGDDGGVVKLWDTRKPDALFSIKIGEEHVADMVTTEAQKYLACAGGDGVLTAIDLKGGKIFASSEDYDSELTCLGLFRSDTKLLAGSSKGKMYLFNWKEFGLHSDEYMGLKGCVSSMIPITQNIVVTGGEDGVLRAAHMFPQRQLGVVGHHSLPVERLDISHDGRLVASASHNNDICFWNISFFEELENIIDVNHKQNKKKDMSNNLPSSRLKNASDFFSGLA